MAAHFFIPKTPKGLVNVSVVRDDGHRLSLAADDSCGAAATHIRVSLLELDSDEKDVGNEVTYLTPETYLRTLAAFLGYSVTPIPAVVCDYETNPFCECPKHRA